MAQSILVIDDNSTNLELITYLLTYFGYKVSASLTGQEGIEIAFKEHHDLILCDIHMSPMDGYEVVQILQQTPQLNTIPRIAITALAMVGDREKFLAAGFHGYISKPIDPELFASQIQQFLTTTEQSIA